MSDLSRVARRVLLLRKYYGVTLPELAKRANLSKATVSKLENEIGDPTLSTLTKLAKALHRKTHQLIQ